MHSSRTVFATRSTCTVRTGNSSHQPVVTAVSPSDGSTWRLSSALSFVAVKLTLPLGHHARGHAIAGKVHERSARSAFTHELVDGEKDAHQQPPTLGADLQAEPR